MVALARNPDNVDGGPGIEARRYDVTVPETAPSAFEGVDVVLSCLGNDFRGSPVVTLGTAQIVEHCPSLTKLVVVSSVGVGSSFKQCVQVSWVFARVIRPLILRKAFRDLERMEAFVADHPITSVIVRPVGLANGSGPAAKGHTETETVARTVTRQAVAEFMVGQIDDSQWDNRAVTVAPPMA